MPGRAFFFEPGPGDDRDWILAGAVWWDFISPRPLRPGKVVPFASELHLRTVARIGYHIPQSR